MEHSAYTNPQQVTLQQLKQAQAGDQNAIAELYQLTYPAVFTAVRAILISPLSALDLVTESYLKAFSQLGQLQKPEEFPVLILGIALQKTWEKLRGAQSAQPEAPGGGETELPRVSLENLPDLLPERQKIGQLLDGLLSGLTPESRMALVLYYHIGLTAEKTAKLLNLTEDRVKNSIRKGISQVEAAAGRLQTQGEDLQGLAPMAFLLWLLRADQPVPSFGALQKILGRLKPVPGPGTAAAGTGGAPSAAAKTAAGKKRRWPLIAAAAGAAVLLLGIAAGLTACQIRKHRESLTAEQTAPQQMLPTAPGKHTAATELPSEPETADMPTLSVQPEDAQVTAATQPPQPAGYPAEGQGLPAEAAYGSVINEYAAAMEADNYLQDPHVYLPFAPMSMDDYHLNGYTDRSFYYSYYDVNRDGLRELLIGYGSQADPQVVDIYTLNGGQVYQLVMEPTLGMSSHLKVLWDGMLFLQNTEKGGLTLYSLENSHLKWEKEFTMDPDLDPTGNPDYEEMLQTVREKGQAMITNWVPLTEQDRVPAEVRDACGQVVDQYRALMALDHQAFCDGAYSDLAYAEDVRIYHAHRLQAASGDAEVTPVRMLYAMQDVDGDGIPELFAGYLDRGNTPVICRAFAFDGSGMEPLWQEYGMVLRDGTVISLEEQGERVATVQQLVKSRPVDIKDPYFAVGCDSDVDQGIDYHGKMFFPSNWKEITAAEGPAEAAPEPAASSFEEILKAYMELGSLGQAGCADDPEGCSSRFDPMLGQGVAQAIYEGAGADPVHGQSIFYLNYDENGDGREDLLVGYGVSPGRVTVLAMYTMEDAAVRYTPGSQLEGRDIPGTPWGSSVDPWNYLCAYAAG